MEFLHKTWVVIKTITQILSQSRFSLIIVLITAFMLEFVGQLKDILVGLSYPQSALQVTFFIVAVNWLAFQSWAWARYIYNRTYSVTDGLRGEKGYQRWLIDWLPRIYAVIVFVVAYRSAMRAGIDNIAYGIIWLGFVVLLFLIYRRDLSRLFSTAISKIPDKSMFYFTWVVIGVSTVFAIASPVDFGAILGAGAVMFLGLGSIIPIGTKAVSATRKNGFPVVGFILLWAVVISQWNDNHHVREIKGQKEQTGRILLKQNLEDWLAQRDTDKPMVVVATAGGGLRASYWTGVIMGRFQEQIPEFSNQVFAISGVSGGSVGAVFYNAALANEDECAKGGKNCFENKLLQSIGQDYLAPTVTSMLYGDLIQRFVPFPVFSDRAAALEQSWEAGFAKTYPDTECGLDKPFTSFYGEGDCAKGKWLPRLLLNGTYEESGRRLLTTSFKVDANTFLDTHDFYYLNDYAALRASTAGLNSARFSYVSPGGTFGPVDGDNVGHVIDGGYFENYGANTLINLLDWLGKHPRQPLANGLIIIAISNDSSIPLKQYEIDAAPAKAKPQNFLNELLAPILGLVNTRSSHAMLAFKQLEQYSQQIKNGACVDMVHFYIQPDKGQEPPLGWILSDQAKVNMRRQIKEGENYFNFTKVVNRFSGEPVNCN
jgi:hypothetical protein